MAPFDSGNHKYFCECSLNCGTLGLSSTAQEIFNQCSANTFYMRVTENTTQGFPGQSTLARSIWLPPQNGSLTALGPSRKKRPISPRCACYISWTYFLLWFCSLELHCFHIWTLGIFHFMYDMLVVWWIYCYTGIKMPWTSFYESKFPRCSAR